MANALQLIETGTLAGMLEVASGQEQAALDGGMGEQMQQRGHRNPGAHSNQHQAVLAGRGSREQAFEITFSQRNDPGCHRGDTTHKPYSEKRFRTQQRRRPD